MNKEEVKRYVLEGMKPGDVVYAATSQYANSKATGYWNEFSFYTHPATLRALAKDGLIEVDQFWRGAKITKK